MKIISKKLLKKITEIAGGRKGKRADHSSLFQLQIEQVNPKKESRICYLLYCLDEKQKSGYKTSNEDGFKEIQKVTEVHKIYRTISQKSKEDARKCMKD